jgi:lipopolysaccharide assembly outer membrane protein LptD (OstA)
MRTAVATVVILSLAVTTGSSSMAQRGGSEVTARLIAVIRDRLDRQQPLRLSAGSITLSGETLRLTGRAMIRFDDTSIRAEEIVLNPTTKQIELLGNVDTFLGADVVPEAAPAVPRREFR